MGTNYKHLSCEERAMIQLHLEQRAPSSTDGMLPLDSTMRRLLYQSTHSTAAISTSSTLRPGSRYRRMSSVLYGPWIVSVKALPYESPTLPTEGSMRASRRRSV
jgi:hypothetical protein